MAVTGYLVQRPNEQPRLCDHLRESNPPQCGDPFLTLDGPDPAALGLELEERDGTVWTEGPVQISGQVRGGSVLFVEEVER